MQGEEVKTARLAPRTAVHIQEASFMSMARFLQTTARVSAKRGSLARTTNLNKLPWSVQRIVPLRRIEISATFVFYGRDKQRLSQRFSVPSPSSFIGVVLQRLRSPFIENPADMSPNRSPNPSA